MRRIAILGTGAIGCILGACMADSGLDVTLLSAFRRETAEFLSKNGLIYDSDARHIETAVNARYLSDLTEGDVFDIVFLAVKSNDLEDAANRLKFHLRADGCVVTLQNGINEDLLNRLLGRERVVAGVSFTGGKIVAPGHVENHAGRFVVGEQDGSITPRLKEIADILSSVKQTEMTSDIRLYQWEKLGKVSITVPTATVSGSYQFETFTNRQCQTLFAWLALECMNVAVADGVALKQIEGLDRDQWIRVKNGEDLLKMRKTGIPVDQMPKRVVDAYTKDIQAGNALEVAFTNGAIVRLGKKHSIPTPVNELLLETIEKIRRGEIKAGSNTLAALLSALKEQERKYPMGGKAYPWLLSHLTICGKEYRNRVGLSPMSRWGMPEENWKELENRAAGGAAVVCTGECFVDDEYSCRENDPPRRFVDPNGEEMRIATQYVQAIKRHGALAMVELNHCGQSKVSAACSNKIAIGPNEWVQEDGIHNVAMDRSMMEHVADNYAQCAAFMKKAGFDGAVVLCGHGWLLHQFLSPRMNWRTDEYGGSLENRSRFPLLVLKRIRERCGPDFIMELRVSGDEGVEGGLGVEEVARFCKMAVDAGLADIIQVSQGIYREPVFSREFPTLFDEPACNRENAKYIRDICKCPVSLVGAINSPDLIEELIENGYCDIALMGRQHFADVKLPQKVAEGRADDVRHCVRCGRCFEGPHETWAKVDDAGKVLNKMPPICTVNPNLNRRFYAQDTLTPTGHHMRVVVIGGGPGGMTAALAAAERGHDVTLVEKTDTLGGLLQFADYDVHKEDLRFFKDQLIRRMERAGVKVLMNTAFSKDVIEKVRPEHILCAVGSTPFAPPIRGIENVLHALEVYWHPEKIGRRVIMAGGGLVGCETAMHLADTGHEVTIIEMMPELARESIGTADLHRAKLLDLIEHRCRAFTGMKCTEITPTSVAAEDQSGNRHDFTADTVVYALGLRPNTAIVEECRQIAGDIPFDAFGDCVKAQAVAYAGFDAVTAAYRI